jgi:hypothetical protein
MTLETSAWASTFTWIDRTADLVAGVNYSIGGRVGTPGQSQVDVGTLNATFKNLATAPLVGDLVRLRRTGTTEYAFIGYVQDVSQQVVFDNSVSLNTPVVLTTINCLDWVGYISQFQVVGVGGLAATTFAVENSYPYQSRARALNNVVDATNATQLIAFDATSATSIIGDTDMVGTIADHLDLTARTQNLFWYPTLSLPTNKTTGRTGLIQIRPLTLAPSSGYTFTDLAGSAGQLHYTEIDFSSSSQNVANVIVVNNRSRFNVVDPEVTRIGGFNQENFFTVNNSQVIGVGIDTTWSESDATSITTYGARQTQIDTCVALPAVAYNSIINPSAEYSDDGYTGGANNKVRRREPLKDANPFAAYTGQWAIRSRNSAAATTVSINYSGGESDGIPVEPSVTYYFRMQAARGTVSRTDMRAQIRVTWLDDNEATISTSTGSNVTLTNANTWYSVGSGASLISPAGAVRATVSIIYSRSGGGNISSGDRLWSDALLMTEDLGTPYFDGDTAWTTTNGYLWTGGVGISPSYKVTNDVDTVATEQLARYSTTSNRITRIRWNAQEDLTKLSLLRVGRTVDIIYDGTTTTHRIVGVDGNISPERYMIDYYLEKV